MKKVKVTLAELEAWSRVYPEMTVRTLIKILSNKIS